MPDGSTAAFAKVRAVFDSGAAEQALATATGADDLRQTLGLPDLVVRSRLPLAFGCRCSYEKMLALLGAMPIADLEDMLTDPEGQTITCHFCGTSHVIPPQEIRTILTLRSAAPDSHS